MLANVDLGLSGRLVLSPGLSRGINANLRYLRDDPFAVRLAFPAEISLEGGDGVEWIFARELLDDGLYGPAGDGDIHLWPCGPSRMMIEFESPHGVAMVEFAAGDVRRFLEWSYRVVAAGDESRYLDLDADLAALLDR